MNRINASNTDSKKSKKEVHEFKKNSIEQDINSKVEKHDSKAMYKSINYKVSKKMRWYDYLTVLSVSTTYIIISLLMQRFIKFSKNGNNIFEILITTGFILFIALFIINGYLRNKKTAKYFNNKIKRYETTLDEKEGFSRRISKIFILISLILFITSIACWLIL
ncbi:hypothetical protein EELLY_v1c00680 [Entomoplasma ellychniae]|uniref:DUF3899 domain-containing protein n=1 Tax=Entomoplasma ellychniae TaxID=2114 RepID=A0A8E2QWV2_9MOLU|nr:hypothetical protein [Entomoplasma ellychniae]PPE04393.1 hypothetical protein EELLY_v1c00680 [Entomoplasma ellychniae]